MKDDVFNGTDGVASGFRRIATLLVCLTSGIFTAMMFAVVMPILPSIADSYGGEFGKFVAQMVMTAPAVGVILGGPLAGLLGTRCGPRTLTIVSLAMFGILGGSEFLLTNAWVLIASRLLLGVCAVGIGIGATSLVASLFNDTQRRRLIAWATALGGLSGICSILLSGMIAEHFHWRSAFLIYSFAIVIAVVAVLAVPRMRRQASTVQAAIATPGLASSSGTLFALWPLFLFTAALGVVNFMVPIQGPFLLSFKDFSGPAIQSWIMAPASLASMIGAASHIYFDQRYGAKGVLVLLLVLMASGQIGMAVADEALSVAMFCFITGFGSGLVTPYIMNLVVDRASVAARTQAIGLVYTFGYLGEFLNPFLVTPVRWLFNIEGAFITFGSIMLVIAGCLIVGSLVQVARNGARMRSNQ